MDKSLKDLMQISIVSENNVLSDMIKDILPAQEQRFTNLEIEAEKKQEFSLVIYRKQNIFVKFFHTIKFTLEKMKIMKHSKEFELSKNQNNI